MPAITHTDDRVLPPRQPTARSQLQRRVLAVLTTAQVFAGVGVAAAAAVGPLAAVAVSGSVSVGGAAATAMVLGTAVSSLLIARVADRAGRRRALALGYTVGALGAIGVTAAAWLDSWPLMLIAFLPYGAGNAAGLAARFAATDLAAPTGRARALGTVMWATTAGAVAGPALAGSAHYAAHATSLTPTTAPLLLGGLAFAIAAALIGAGLRPDPLLFARTCHLPEPADKASTRPITSPRVLWAAPRTRLAVGAIAVAQLVMVALMSMTSVHMDHAGASLNLVGVVISLHMAGMFALAPGFGWLTDRSGPLPVLAIGTLLLAGAGLITATADGRQAELLVAGLTALGLGWSATVVAGSSLITEAVSPRHRAGAQGLTDTAMSLSGAAGGIAAGLTVATSSYGMLGWATTVSALSMLVVLLVIATRNR